LVKVVKQEYVVEYKFKAPASLTREQVREAVALQYGVAVEFVRICQGACVGDFDNSRRLQDEELGVQIQTEDVAVANKALSEATDQSALESAIATVLEVDTFELPPQVIEVPVGKMEVTTTVVIPPDASTNVEKIEQELEADGFNNKVQAMEAVDDNVAISVLIITDAPTVTPTFAPSATPSVTPTVAPTTPTPTLTPTDRPTSSPTNATVEVVTQAAPVEESVAWMGWYVVIGVILLSGIAGVYGYVLWSSQTPAAAQGGGNLNQMMSPEGI
jgi:hypothetical protein